MTASIKSPYYLSCVGSDSDLSKLDAALMQLITLNRRGEEAQAHTCNPSKLCILLAVIVSFRK